MDLGLAKKVFIVTGGAHGIGAAIVWALAGEDALPVIVDRSHDGAQALLQRLHKTKKQGLSIIRELGEAEACRDIVEQTLATFGRIDGIVNNAGVNDRVGLASGTPETFRQCLTKNLSHYYDLVHYALDSLKSTRGTVVNIASKTGVTGQGETSGYAASKGAQLALTREWAVELAPFGIRVNALVPAEVMTPHYQGWLDAFDDPTAKLNNIVSRIPLEHRMTRPEEIASMTVFLLSERSAHTTGQWVFVDGGYVHLDRSMT